MGVTSLVLINHTTDLISEHDLARFVNALDVQFRHDVTPVWGRYLLPWVARDTQNLDPKVWQLHLWRSPREASEAGFLGRHSTQGADYVPIGHVFIENCLINKVPWTRVASHEAIEMAGNEWLNLEVVRVLDDSTVELWPRELCDAVQGVGYAVNGVELSDFVYPEFFIEKADGPYDHCRVLDKPFSIHKTGYASILFIKNGYARRRDYYGAACPEWCRTTHSLTRKHAHWRAVK
jgi:hypothetical protein